MLKKQKNKTRGKPPVALLISWTAMVLFSALSLLLLQQEATRLEALSAARAYASQAQGYLRWASVMGGLYAKSELVRPSVFLPSRQHIVNTSEGERLVFVNPFQMVREENALRSQLPEPGANIRAVSLNPINPENAPDEWERAGLLAGDGLQERSTAMAGSGGPVLRLLFPLVFEHTCADCHKYQGEKVGDTRGGISVSVPLKPYSEQGRKRTAWLLLVHVLVWFAGVGLLVLSSRILARRDRGEQEEDTMLRSLSEKPDTLEYLLDAEGRPLYVSPSIQTLFSITPETLRADPGILASLVHPDDQQRYRELTAPQVFPRQREGELVRVLSSDGLMRHHFVLCAPTDDTNGRRLVHCTHIDVSSWHEKGEAAVRRDREKLLFSFAGGVAHDFNNVLASIATFVHLLKEEFSDREDIIRDYITPLRIAFRLGKHFTANLLAFSQRQAVALKSISLNRAVKDIEEVVRAMLSDEIACSCTLAPREMSVFADQNQVEQLVLNLAHNAKDAMPAGGQLAMGTELSFLAGDLPGKPDMVPAGTYMRLWVRDTGGGIVADRFEDIFQPFYSTKKSKQGIGIGLVVVRGIVRRHNAFLHIDSTAGHGMEASVYFAVATEAGRESTPGGNDIPVGPLPPGERCILLVDDDAFVRNSIARVLQQEGYTVLEAASGEEALEVFKLNQGSIELLVVDQVLPGISGVRACQEIRALRPHMKLLFLSGRPLEQMPESQCPQAGVFFLEKPVNIDLFLNVVREMIIES